MSELPFSGSKNGSRINTQPTHSKFNNLLVQQDVKETSETTHETYEQGIRILAEQKRAHEGKEVEQFTFNFDEMYQAAEQSVEHYSELIEGLASRTEGKVRIPPLKNRARAEAKLRTYPNGVTSIYGSDILRGSLLFKSYKDLISSLDTVFETLDVVEIKDRFENPFFDGYRDIQLKIRMPNGLVCELQLHVEKLFEFTQNEGHKHYEEAREIHAEIVHLESSGADKAIIDSKKASLELKNKLTRARYDSVFRETTGLH